MVYLCVTSFGMLNGLIGIFGDSFLRNIDTNGEVTSSGKEKMNHVSVDAKLHEIMHLLSVQGNKIDELTAVVEVLSGPAGTH